MEKRRIALLGSSLILETLGESLRRFSHDEVMYFPSMEAAINGIAEVKPEVIIFDLYSTRPHTTFSLLECDPGLVLIGVSSDSNLVKMWTGKQMCEMSFQDLLKVIHKQTRNPPINSIQVDEIHQSKQKKKKQ